MSTRELAMMRWTAGLALHLMVILGYGFLSGCSSSALSEMPSDAVRSSRERQAIEHIIKCQLCDSARNCRYHAKSYGMGSGQCWIYFEVPRADLLKLLEACPALPVPDELGENSVARENIEELTQRSNESIPWWRPETLTNRQYASRDVPFGKLGIFGLQFDVCTGQLQGRWYGLYMIRFSSM